MVFPNPCQYDKLSDPVREHMLHVTLLRKYNLLCLISSHKNSLAIKYFASACQVLQCQERSPQLATAKKQASLLGCEVAKIVDTKENFSPLPVIV